MEHQLVPISNTFSNDAMNKPNRMTTRRVRYPICNVDDNEHFINLTGQTTE